MYCVRDPFILSDSSPPLKFRERDLALREYLIWLRITTSIAASSLIFSKSHARKHLITELLSTYAPHHVSFRQATPGNLSLNLRRHSIELKLLELGEMLHSE